MRRIWCHDLKALSERFEQAGTEFDVPRVIRFEGGSDEHQTLFFLKPSGNPIKIEGFTKQSVCTEETGMSDYVFPPAPQPALRVQGEDALFPVRRIYCVGRNYADHAREMGHDPDREPPFFFMKPASAIAADGDDVAYPPLTEDLHYEGELVVALGAGGEILCEAEARAAVYGYAIGNDLTRRDMQAEAKSLRRPWALSKGFESSAVIGPIHKFAETGELSRGRIASYVGGELRQDGDLSQMIWTIPEVIMALSRSIRLSAGDLVMTGTPAGVGALVRGDLVAVEIEGLGRIETRIV